MAKVAGAGYAILVHWTKFPYPPDWHEVITWEPGGFQMSEAEKVATECRRLGATTASIHKAAAAKKLAGNFNGDRFND